MESQTSNNGGRGPNFSLLEDEALCKAWLAVKENEALGSSHRTTYWDRVLEAFNELLGVKTHRTARAISARWGIIQQSINRLCGFITQLEATNKRGVTTQSLIAEAKHLFSVAHKCPFKWDSCWEILKGNPKWQDLHVVQFNTMSRDSKKMKPTLENDPIAIEGASSTPTSPGSQPATPALVLLDLDKTPTSLDTLLRERSVGREAEEDGKKETGEQIIHLSKVVEESNTLLKTFISSIDERLARSEDIARRNLHLKEEKVRQGQLEMRERQFERDRKIMDMNLDHMPPMQRQFYEMKQREICDRWKNGGQNFEKGGSSCEEHEWNGDREV